MKKILLILDLDQTLVHTVETPLENFPPSFALSPYHHVYLRPYLKDFLYTCSAYFELAIWSSAKRDYVHQVIQKIIPTDIALSFVWSRKKCTFGVHPKNTSHGNSSEQMLSRIWFKKLAKVKKQGYSLNKILIVDNSPEKVLHDIDNAIYVEDFRGNTSDQELLLLSKYLPTLHTAKDVKVIEKKSWKDSIHTSKTQQ